MRVEAFIGTSIWIGWRQLRFWEYGWEMSPDFDFVDCDIYVSDENYVSGFGFEEIEPEYD